MVYELAAKVLGIKRTEYYYIDRCNSALTCVLVKNGFSVKIVRTGPIIDAEYIVAC